MPWSWQYRNMYPISDQCQCAFSWHHPIWHFCWHLHIHVGKMNMSDMDVKKKKKSNHRQKLLKNGRTGHKRKITKRIRKERNQLTREFKQIRKDRNTRTNHMKRNTNVPPHAWFSVIPSRTNYNSQVANYSAREANRNMCYNLSKPLQTRTSHI